MDRPIFDDESLADRVGMVSGLGDVVLVHNPLTVREKVTLLEELMQFVQLWLCKDILEAFTGRVSPKGRGFVQILEQVLSNLEVWRIRKSVEDALGEPLE